MEVWVRTLAFTFCGWMPLLCIRLICRTATKCIKTFYINADTLARLSDALCTVLFNRSSLRICMAMWYVDKMLWHCVDCWTTLMRWFRNTVVKSYVEKIMAVMSHGFKSRKDKATHTQNKPMRKSTVSQIFMSMYKSINQVERRSTGHLQVLDGFYSHVGPSPSPRLTVQLWDNDKNIR